MLFSLVQKSDNTAVCSDLQMQRVFDSRWNLC